VGENEEEEEEEGTPDTHLNDGERIFHLVIGFYGNFVCL